MKDPKIIYEPHPVSPKRKAELREQGYQIVDAVFEPAGSKKVALVESAPVAQAPAAPAKKAK